MLRQLLSVFLEFRCPFCNRTSSQDICQYCLVKLAQCQFHPRDRRSWWGEMPVFAWGRYEGQLKRAIALMKYHNHPEIGIVLGELLAEAWLKSNLDLPQKISVIPIPLHRHKMRDRGFNQAKTIARSFCRLTGYSLCDRTLIRVKDTQAMFNLNPEARIQNLQGAFRLTGKLPKHPVLLLDDIYTMGTTVRESAKILRRNKIRTIGSIAVAKTIEPI